MLTDRALTEMFTTLNIRMQRTRNDYRCSTEAHLTEFPLTLLHGVSTTVRQDHQWSIDSNDSGIDDELDLLLQGQGNSLNQSRNNNSSLNKAMVRLPSKIGSNAQPITLTKMQRPGATADSIDLTTKSQNVFAIRMTTAGPSLIQISTVRLQVDGLLAALLRRTQRAGLPVRQLPVFFESPCNPQKHQQPRLRNSPADCLPDIVAGSEYYQPGRCLGKGNFGQVYMCHVTRLASYGRPASTGSARALKSTQHLGTYRMERYVHTSLQCGHTEESYRSTFLLWMASDLEIMHRGHKTGWLLLELAPGGSLQDLLASLHGTGRQMQEREAAFYLAEMACALDYLHSCSFLHLDFKADNVLLSASGHARLADFGHALQLDGTGRAESHLTAGLSTFHLPPELLRCAPTCKDCRDGWQPGKVFAKPTCKVITKVTGKVATKTTGKIVTKAADWFSYGCLAFWLLHNQYPIVPPKYLRCATEYADYMENVGYKRLDWAFLQRVSPAYRQLVTDFLHPRPSRRPCGFAHTLRHRDIFAECLPARMGPSEARSLVEASALLPPYVPLPLM